MLQNLNLSFASFARRAAERLDETVSATRGAMEAAYARRQTRSGSIESEAIRMRNCISTLESLKIDFEQFLPQRTG